MRTRSIQRGARVGFRLLEHLRRFGLGLATLRITLRGSLAPYCSEASLARFLCGLGLLDQRLGLLAQIFESAFPLREQIEKRSKEYPAEYKPKNQEGNNQQAEGSPVGWDMHFTASPLKGLKTSSILERNRGKGETRAEIRPASAQRPGRGVPPSGRR